MKTISETNIPGLKFKCRGKVRDIYDLGDYLLIVTTDRISAFDVVLPTPIPGKGEVLTKMARFWFKRTGHMVKNHLSDLDVCDVISDEKLASELECRSMVVKKATPLPIEAIVRGYLSGSAWKEYLSGRSVCGIAIADGLVESSKLPEPLFTPTSKAAAGSHDENITFGQMKDLMGGELAEKIRSISLRLYEFASVYSLGRGVIIADTKFEFGLLDGELIVIDEMLTPDSSRFWPLSEYRPGRAQPSFDKQFVRDWLEKSGWNKRPPAPELPRDIVEKTSNRYGEALRLLVGTHHFF